MTSLHNVIQGDMTTIAGSVGPHMPAPRGPVCFHNSHSYATPGVFPLSSHYPYLDTSVQFAEWTYLKVILPLDPTQKGSEEISLSLCPTGRLARNVKKSLVHHRPPCDSECMAACLESCPQQVLDHLGTKFILLKHPVRCWHLRLTPWLLTALCLQFYVAHCWMSEIGHACLMWTPMCWWTRATFVFLLLPELVFNV